VNLDFQAAPPNVFAELVQWLDAMLLGTIATTIAVLAVASVGFLLMSGRIDVRRAAQVIAGCFILFGASSIAAGIMGSLGPDGSAQVLAEQPPSAPAYPPAMTQAPVQALPYDPYAGAALPTRG
jgi:type IV secretory pathway VirB2 component (pilin)